MHFQGVPEAGYLGIDWIRDRTEFLSGWRGDVVRNSQSGSGSWVWTTMQKGSIIVYRPDGLKKPEVFSLWERFQSGGIDADDVRNRLKIIRDIMKHRPN